ncbi:MAG: hypothetical protein K6E50_06750 [Lachnospiraceae bacterium]|nr:hypothetical protein [Lachnospiraceae bacterium]
MRNRGYRFIIRDLGFQSGYCALCINSTWINELLIEAGVDPRDFRRLSWEDLCRVQTSERARSIMEELRPGNFWQMCDAVTMLHAKYDVRGRVYRERWFKRYPLLVIEDIYELLLEEGFADKEALEITEFFEEQSKCYDWRELRDFLELYDVPEGLSEALLCCRYLPKREHMIREVLKHIARANVLVTEQMGE